MRRRPRWRRARRGFLGFCLFLVLALVFRGWWLPLALGPLLTSQAASLAQLDLAFDSIETDGLTYLEMRGIRVQARQEQLLQHATLSYLRVEFHLPSLWKQGLDGVTSIDLIDLALRTDLQWEDPSPEAAPEELDLSELSALWPQLPWMHLEKILWTDVGKGQFRLDELGLSALGREGKRAVHVRGPSVDLLADVQVGAEEAHAALHLQRFAWSPEWRQFLPGTIPESFRAKAKGTILARVPLADPAQTRFTVDKLSAEGSQHGATWTCQGRSAGELPQSWTIADALEAWSAELTFTSKDWPQFASAWGLELASPAELGALQAMSLELQYAKGEFQLGQALVETERLVADASSSRFTLAHNDAGWQLGVPQLQLQVEAAEDFPLADGRVLPAGRGQVALRTGASIALGASKPPVQLSLMDFQWESADGRQWLRQEQNMQLDWSAQGFTISPWRLRTPAGSLTLEATLPNGFAPEGAAANEPWSASLASEHFDLAALALIPGIPLLPVAAGTMEGVVHLAGSQAAPLLHGQWSFHDLQPQAEQIELGFPERVALALQFSWEEQGLTVDSLSYQDAAAEVETQFVVGLPLSALQAPADWQEAWRTLAIEGEGRAMVRDQAWLAERFLVDLPLRQGTASLSFTAAGLLGNPNLHAELLAEGWQPQAELAAQLPAGAVRLSATADWREQNLVAEARVQSGERELAVATGTLRLRDGEEAQMSVRLLTENLQPDWLGWEGVASLQADLEGFGKEWTLEAQVTGQQMRPIPETEEGALPAVDFAAQLRWDQTGLHLAEAQAEGPLVQAQATGSLDLPLQPETWQDLDFEALAFQASLTGQIDALSWLATLPALRRAQGRLGFQATADGTVGAPQWRGEFDLEDAAFRLNDAGLPSLEALELHVALREDGLRFHDSRGELGAAPFVLEGSMLRQGDNSLLADLTMRGDNLLLYRTSGVKIRANSELTVRGTWPQLTIGGNLAFTDSRVVQNIPLLRSPIGPPRPPTPGGLTLFRLDPPLDQLRFALELSSEQGIGLRSNLARGVLRPALRLEGTGAVPVLRGDVFLDKVSMTLPATRLYLQPSVARFLEDDPFHPRLNLFGRSSLQGYDVQIVVTGPYDQPQVLLSSTPPLKEDDIILLLTTGQPPADRLDRRAAAGTAALYLARDFLTTFFGSDSVDAEESLLDRLEINFGRDQTRNGVETLNGRLRLRDDVWREGDSLFLEGGRDAFEDYFLGLEWLLRFP